MTDKEGNKLTRYTEPRLMRKKQLEAVKPPSRRVRCPTCGQPYTSDVGLTKCKRCGRPYPKDDPEWDPVAVAERIVGDPSNVVYSSSKANEAIAETTD